MNRKIISAGMAALCCLGLLACNSQESGQREEELSGQGILLSDMDQTVDPGENFFEYANGGWLKKTEIPDDQTRWGAFNELRETNNAQQKEIMEKAANRAGEYTGDALKAIQFYNLGMDSLKAEEAGIAPLRPFLEQISSMQSKKDLPAVAAALNKAGVGVLFSDYVYVDRKNSQAYAYYFAQGGLSLPDKDYYLNDKKEFQDIRSDYQDYIVRLLTLAGEKESRAKKAAQAILNMETDLARVSMDRTIARNPDSTYHKSAFKAFADRFRNFSLQDYVQASDISTDKVDDVVVNQPEFYRGLDQVIARYGLEDWKNYLKFHTVNEFAGALGHDFVQASFDFYDARLQGAQAMRPRWKRVLDGVNGYLGQAFGKIYVEEVFPPEAKENVQAMIRNVRSVFAERIQNLDWMSDATKQKALEKLESFNVKIAYPDEWKAYEDFNIDTASFVQTVINGNYFDHQKNIEKLGKPVDRSEWFMNPQTVNAYYSPTFNEIVFPAAILQPPFYDYQADKAVNYGGIGAVIGHELTHGFDDSGRKYNAVGNQEDWWTKDDAERFESRAQQVVRQFDSYTVLDSLSLNGKLTLGENIADLGGVTLAYYAMQKDFEKNGRPEEINGLTPEQRFFINWATVWRTKFRDEALRNQIMTDPHAPGQFRAWAPLSNMEEFQEAFNIKKGSSMVRPDSLKALIW